MFCYITFHLQLQDMFCFKFLMKETLHFLKWELVIFILQKESNFLESKRITILVYEKMMIYLSG